MEMGEGIRETLEAAAASAEKDLAFGTRQAYTWQTTSLYFQLHFMSVTLALLLRWLCGSSRAL